MPRGFNPWLSSRRRRLIIGDVHGCFDELRELLDRAGLSSDDEIIAVGDILDRGPDSPAVLHFFQCTPNAGSLLGNHERKHLGWFRGVITPALSQRITRLQLGEERYPAVCAYLEALPQYLELPEAIVVHGLLEPGVPLAEQHETVMVGVMSGHAYLQERYSRPWYELYDGEKPVIVGHQDYLGTGAPFIVGDRVFGIDTGCYRDGALTGLLLPESRLVSVPARADHWSAVRAAHASRLKAAPRSARSGLAAEGAARADVERALCRVLDHIMAEHGRVLGELRNEGEWDSLTEREQAKRYAERVRRSPLAAYLYRARQGGFSVERLRRSFSGTVGRYSISPAALGCDDESFWSLRPGNLTRCDRLRCSTAGPIDCKKVGSSGRRTCLPVRSGLLVACRAPGRLRLRSVVLPRPGGTHQHDGASFPVDPPCARGFA